MPDTWHGYAPREPMRCLILLLERLCAANKSDSCIVSIPKIQELLKKWFGIQRCRRTILYHTKAAAREHLIIKQSRWRVTDGKIIIKRRTRYRIAWREFQRLQASARHALKFAALVNAPARRETVQRFAHGLQELLRTVVPNTT